MSKSWWNKDSILGRFRHTKLICSIVSNIPSLSSVYITLSASFWRIWYLLLIHSKCCRPVKIWITALSKQTFDSKSNNGFFEIQKNHYRSGSVHHCVKNYYPVYYVLHNEWQICYVLGIFITDRLMLYWKSYLLVFLFKIMAFWKKIINR